MSSDNLSEERLNAFVDGELGIAEKSEVFEALAANEGISQRACELRQLSELVRHAYDHPPQSQRQLRQEARRVSPFGRAAAASLLVGLGATVGWLGHKPPSQPSADLTGIANVNAMVWGDGDRAFHSTDLSGISDQNQLTRVIMHLNTSSPEKFEHALDTAEQLLSSYAAVYHEAEIEVVANASAIKMLRSGYSPYAERVRALQEKYFNLTFLACKDAIDHEREMGQGQNLTLLPDVEVTPSALEHILTRMNEGWVYLNI